MAHDSQIPQELPKELRETKKDSSPRSDSQKASLALLADWWNVFGQIYRDDPTELLATAFRETLSPLKPEILHQACLIACRECPKFRPKPGEIYAIADALMAKRQKGNRPGYLDEPVTSEQEREAAISELGYQELRAKILGGARP